MSVASRLVLWGKAASGCMDKLISDMVAHVHRAARLQSLILWATDGLGTWRTQILHFFRSTLLSGHRGRPPLVPWAELHIVQVVGRTYRDSIERRLAFGDLFEASHLIEESQGKRGTINTAFVERLNATLRT